MKTPITDALIDSGEITRGTTAAAVRKLEAELAALTKERDEWANKCLNNEFILILEREKVAKLRRAMEEAPYDELFEKALEETK